MEISADNADHLLDTLAGFESLQNNVRERNSSTAYTTTVLKLNGVDFYKIAGQEGILSALSSAGNKIYEMIKNFIKSVKDFFFGSKGNRQAQAIKDVESSIKDKKDKITIQVKKMDGDGMGDSPLADDIRKASASARAISNVLSGEGIIVRFETIYKNGSLDLGDTFDLISSSHDLMIGMTPKSYNLSEIESAIQKFVSDRKPALDDHNDKSVIIHSTMMADKAAIDLGEMYKKARTGLENVNKDLEKANEKMKRYETAKNEEGLNLARKLVIALGKIGGRLSSLIKLILSTLGSLDSKLNSIMASLELEANKGPGKALLVSFDSLKSFDS